MVPLYVYPLTFLIVYTYGLFIWKKKIPQWTLFVFIIPLIIGYPILLYISIITWGLAKDINYFLLLINHLFLPAFIGFIVSYFTAKLLK